jgi:Spy/CpxP family protein refolding chaperone
MRILPVALLSLSLAGPALAEDRPSPPTTEEVHARLDQRLDRVGATPEQRARIEALVDEARAQREAFKARASGLKAQMKDLLWAEEIDRKALEKVREQAVDLFDEATRSALDQMIGVAEVLTPAQRAQVHDHLAK